MTSIIAWLFGTAGVSWTFVGYLICSNPNVLGGCLPNGTHFYTASHLSEFQCLAYKQQAAAIPGGAGGTCIAESN